MGKKCKITILGSGTCVPSLERSSCSVLVCWDNLRLLFDAGAGTIRRLLEAGCHIGDISHLFVSHLHPDHTGELVSLLFSGKYPKHMARKIPMTLIGGVGLERFYGRLQQAFGHWIVPEQGMLRLLEADNKNADLLDFGNFQVCTYPMAHTPESIGYRLILGDKTIVYSGDTDYCPDLVRLAEDADLFICECATPDENKVEGHMSPSWAGKAASLAGAKRLILTHLYPECDRVDMVSQCRKNYDGPLNLAYDLMEICL